MIERPGKSDDGGFASGWRPGPLLPRDRAQDLLLMFVTAVLAFFACLAIIAAVGADRAASGWAGELRGSATVLIRTTGSESPDAAAERAAEVLSGLKGVEEATAVEKEKSMALLEPWFGRGTELAELPVPRLVTVQFDPKSPAPSARALEQALNAKGLDGVVDDHSRWIKDIVRGGELARAAAIGVAALTALAAAAVIAFATHADLLARREIVEVLHLAGAEDGFVVALFQNRLAQLAAMASAAGAVAAALVAAAVRLMGGGGGLTPVLPIAWTDLAAIAPAPLIAALVAAASARLTASGLVRELDRP
jgi:cell division transport system permease protein